MNDVSVVMPVYNGARHLVESLDSVLGQSAPADEIVVVDDGSTDESPRILQNYKNALRVTRTANAGLAAARNEGVARASSRWVALLDQDDRWLPSKLEYFFSRLRHWPDAELIFSDAVVLSSGGRRLHPVRCDPGAGDLFSRLYRQNRIVSSTVLMRKSVWERSGPFRGDFAHPAAMVDWEFFLRAASIAPALYIGAALTEYRIHSGSSLRSRLDDVRADQFAVLKTHANHPRLTEEAKAQSLDVAAFESGVRFLAGGFHRVARAEFDRLRGSAVLGARSTGYWLATFLPPAIVRWGQWGRRWVLRGSGWIVGCFTLKSRERYYPPPAPPV